jgi:hypothetical protein
MPLIQTITLIVSRIARLLYAYPIHQLQIRISQRSGLELGEATEQASIHL